nr:LLM class flavin-dependent oxidoreductase [Gordonia desulfuricans]
MPENRPLIGIRVPPCAPVSVLAETASRAEAAGFDEVWFPDSQFIWRDVWVTMAAAAAATSRIRLGVAVTNFETRHPSVTASAVRTLQEMAPNRVIVGLGTGSSSLKHIGVRPTRQARMREGFEELRALLSGKPRDTDGEGGQLRDAIGVPPLYMAASGPKNLEFAGGVADGVMILSGISEDLLRTSIERVHRGAERAGRNPADVRINIAAFGHVTEDVRRDCAIVKPLAADLVLRGAGEALADEGIAIKGRPREADPRVYPDYRHAENWDAAAEVAGEVIDDDAAVRFAQRFCLMGDGAEIRSRIEEIAAMGVHEVYVQGVGSYSLPTDLIDGFGKEVLG